jgi:hypothetical protein
VRVLALFTRHSWLRKLRNGLVLLAAAAVLWDGARLWVSTPDAVRITIIHVDGDDGLRPAISTLTLDRTIHNGAVAQRLQRDLAALPLADPFALYSCPIGPGNGYTYNAYSLTWYRAGLPVEQASASQTGCAMWHDDGVFVHLPVNVDTFYATSTRPPPLAAKLAQ